MSVGALIVGGGPAGAAAAITLARAGAPHLLVERRRETGDALCGGFLSWRTLETLAALGVSADELNREPVTQVRLFAGKRVSSARLPRPAVAVSRRRLDSILLERAVNAGSRIERGVSARAVDGVSVRLDDGAILTGDALFLASGKHDVRGLARPAEARAGDPTLGLRVRLPAHPALDRLVGDAVELHLFDRGYAGAARQEDGSVNLCLAVRRSRLHEAGDAAALLDMLAAGSPRLAERLAFGHGPVDAVANVPYGWRAAAAPAGVFRLGDQAGVIPSLAGEGMGIALASGVDAARAWLRDGAAPWQAGFARRIARPIAIADAIRTTAERPALAARALPLLAAAPFLIRIVARAPRLGDVAT